MTAIDVFRSADNLYPLIAGMALAVACALLSVLVVLKRLAFIGEGIAHAGFGGVGLATFLALTGFAADIIIFIICLISGLLIAMLSRTRRVRIDTAIGILLVAAMGIGFMLDQMRLYLRDESWYQWLTAGRPIVPTQWHNVLFGSIVLVDQQQMWLAIIVSTLTILILAHLFRNLIFYAFDETVSRVFGIPATALHYLVLILLTALIVLAMKLAGLILVTAMLVVPGATALLLSRKLNHVLILSVVVGEIGVIVGYLLSFQIMGGRLPTGPFIVLILVLQFIAALIYSKASSSKPTPTST